MEDFIVKNGYFETFVWSWIILGLITYFYLFVQPAPYGRHLQGNWGPQIPSWLGWIIQELPSPLFLTYFFFKNGAPIGDWSNGAWILYGLWVLHYMHRSIIQPLTNPGGNKPIPLMICFSAIFFNLINGYVNGTGLSLNSSSNKEGWLTSPRTMFGLSIMFLGFCINYQSDHILLSLRKPGETGYKIPYGGLYRYISCPNYFGEMVEWTGFAVASWSIPALSFALWTFFNLAPRAVKHHKWYHEKFPGEYPPERRALIPLFCFQNKKQLQQDKTKKN